MSRTTLTIVFIVGAVALSAASFFGGMYAAGVKHPFDMLSGAGGAYSGRVSAVHGSSLVVTLADGSTKTITISNDTRIFKTGPIVAQTPQNLAIGSLVSVNMAGGIAQVIQLLASTPPTAATSSVAGVPAAPVPQPAPSVAP